MAVKPKELRFAVDLTAAGAFETERGVELEAATEWSAEHLLLAALLRCSLQSLRYHARRRGIAVRSAAGSGHTLVAKRETDGRYALVETELALVVETVSEPEPSALTELLARAEHDCFVGSSLTAEPSYRWTVNGRTIGP